jgi:hypothetical protein
MAALFNKAGIPVLEIHSRKPQGYRTKVSNQVCLASLIPMCMAAVLIVSSCRPM